MRSALRENAFARLLVALATGGCALALFAVAAHAWSAPPAEVRASQHGDAVRIVRLSPPPLGIDGWSTVPVKFVLVPPGDGQTWYRIGPAPGAWKRSEGPITVPQGKQILSAVYVAPDGTAGPIAEQIVRSDYRLPLSTVPDSLVTTASGSAVSTGTTSVTSGQVTVLATIRPASPGATMRRIGGTDRYDTAALLSASGFTRAPTVIIATGEKFPDALTASGLAGCLKAPVLLVHRSSIPPQVVTELRRLRTTRVIICGGPPAVSDAVATKFKRMGIKVERLSGKTRYETAIAVSQRIQKLTGRHDRVFFARGDAFPDALLVSPLAYATRTPILLTTPGALNPTVAARLAQARYTSAVLIGGIGWRPEGSIRGRIGLVDRWGSGDPYDTSVQVAAHETLEGTLSWGYVGMARGDIFPDALCGGAIAGSHNGVILLTPPTALHPEIADALTAHAGEVRLLEVYGSVKALSDAIYNQIYALLH